LPLAQRPFVQKSSHRNTQAARWRVHVSVLPKSYGAVLRFHTRKTGPSLPLRVRRTRPSGSDVFTVRSVATGGPLRFPPAHKNGLAPSSPYKARAACTIAASPPMQSTTSTNPSSSTPIRLPINDSIPIAAVYAPRQADCPLSATHAGPIIAPRIGPGNRAFAVVRSGIVRRYFETCVCPYGPTTNGFFPGISRRVGVCGNILTGGWQPQTPWRLGMADWSGATIPGGCRCEEPSPSSSSLRLPRDPSRRHGRCPKTWTDARLAPTHGAVETRSAPATAPIRVRGTGCSASRHHTNRTHFAARVGSSTMGTL